MLYVCIVEDEPDNTKQLEEYLYRFGKENGVTFEIKTFRDGLDFLENYRPVYDVIFMDIQMPNINGMETARRLRKTDGQVNIIFVTNLLKYAIHGYEVQAFDYIVKPLNYYDFSARMKKFMEHFSTNRKQEILISFGEKMRRVDIMEIYYIEVVGRNLCYHMASGDMVVHESMVSAERKLPAEYFIRCHSGFLVNLNHVQTVDKDSVLVGGQWLPVSRAKKKEFVTAVTKFIAGQH